MLLLKDPSQLTNKQETHTYADHHFHQPFNAFQVGDSDLVPGRFPGVSGKWRGMHGSHHFDGVTFGGD